MKEGPGQPPPQPSSPGGLPGGATSPRPLALPPVPPSSPSPAITLLLLLPFTQPQPRAVGASPPSLGGLPCVQAPCPAVGTPTPYPPLASPSPCPGRCCLASQSPGSGLHVEQAGGWRSPAGPVPRDRERARAVEGEGPGDPVSPPPGRARLCGVNPFAPLPGLRSSARRDRGFAGTGGSAGDARWGRGGHLLPGSSPGSRMDGGSASARGRCPRGGAGPGAGGR